MQVAAEPRIAKSYQIMHAAIKKTIEKQEPSYDELIWCFEQLKLNGDVAVIKFDGERRTSCHTVFISFPDHKREMIRSDESDLKKAMISVLARYIEHG